MSVQVQAAPDTFIYLSATRGFKSGGFNPTANRTGLAYAPEFVWTYEGRFKQTMAGGRVRVNTAAFYSDYQDLQVQTLVQPGVFSSAPVRQPLKAWKSKPSRQLEGACRSWGLSWVDVTFDCSWRSDPVR